MRYPKPLNVSFWDKVDKTGNCWQWMASLTRDGYGYVKYKNRSHRAHRLSWFLHTGKHSHLCVLHKCDNRSCVNPEHLYEGTKKQNSEDMIKRNRHYQGSLTHCKRGHEFNSINTRVYNGSRICRVCDRNRK